jgi:hypothetical protein
MIEGYEDIMKEWSAPSIGHGCCNTVTINPADELDRWAVQQTITILANADYYYTKAEVDSLLKQIKPGMTPEEVQAMINRSIASKAEQADLEALSAQVATNTERILNTYTKQEVNGLLASYYTKIQTNSMFANYSKVEGTTLHLNADNIG